MAAELFPQPVGTVQGGSTSTAVPVPVTPGAGSSGFSSRILVWGDSAGALTNDGFGPVWDSTNMMLGIGTSTPLGAVHVVGQYLGSTNGAANPTYGFTGFNLGLGAESTVAVTLIQGGVERVWADSTGVGIGTTAPTVKLDVIGAGKFSAGLQSSVLNVVAGATFGGAIVGTSIGLSGGISATSASLTSAIVSGGLQTSVLNVIAGATFGGAIVGTSISLTGGISASSASLTSAIISGGLQTSNLNVTGSATFAGQINGTTGVFLGQMLVAAASSNQIPLILQAHSSQAGPIMIAQDSAGGVPFALSSRGAVLGTSASFSGGVASSVLSVVAGATFGGAIVGTSAGFTGGITASSAAFTQSLQTSVLNVIAGATFGGVIVGTSVSLTGGVAATSAVLTGSLQSSVLNVIAGATFGGAISATSGFFADGVRTSVLNVIAGATFGGAIVGTSIGLSGGITGSSAAFTGIVEATAFRASSGTTAVPSYGMKNAAQGINFPTTAAISFVRLGVEQIRITSAFGINTTTPVYALEVGAIGAVTMARFGTPGSTVAAGGIAITQGYPSIAFNRYYDSTKNQWASFNTGFGHYISMDWASGVLEFHRNNVSATAADSTVIGDVTVGGINTSGHWGIGTTAPETPLHVSGNVLINQNDLTIRQFAATPGVGFRRADGTSSAPTSVAGGVALGQFYLQGYTGPDGYTNGIQFLDVLTRGAFTSANYAYDLRFFNIAANSTVNTVRFQMRDNSVTIGGSTADAVGFFGSTGSTQATSFTLSASTATRTVPTTMSTAIGAYTSANMVLLAQKVNDLIAVTNNHLQAMKSYNLLR